MEFRLPPYVTVMKGEASRLDVRRVVVHAGVTEIAEDAFRDWTGLEEIVFESGSRLERIGDRAFAGTALREFTTPESLKVIGSDAFMDCKNLKAITLNNGLESIGDRAFQNSGVEEAHLPSSLWRVGENAFAGCRSLGKMDIGANCGTFTVTTDSAFTVRVRREAAEESSEPMQIEVEDAKLLQEQLK